MRHSEVSAVSESQLMMLVAAVLFVAAVIWFAVESVLYIRHIRRMKRIWELLEKLDPKPKE